MFCRSLLVLFRLAIVLSVLLRFTDSDYPFGIFKFFLHITNPIKKNRDELMCPGKVSSSCSTSGTRCVNLITNPVISHAWGKDWEVEHIGGEPVQFIQQFSSKCIHKYIISINTMVATKLPFFWLPLWYLQTLLLNQPETEHHI
jgi:hypothetical protein